MPTFEESIDVINVEINKRKNKWSLTVLSWLDFDDVAQIIRLHIYRKWEQYNIEKPLCPWLNRIISNQIKNIIRNIYGNYCRPCLRCAAAEGEDGCRLVGKQCNSCPLYAHWEKTKKSAHDTKLPVSLENHTQEVFSLSSDSIDIERTAENLHVKMEKVLKPFEYKVYKLLYMENRSEDDIASIMGYRTSEKGRAPGYRQLQNIKKSIIVKVKKIVHGGEIDFV
jgi:DNA-directed RNA polymerase specialized sigma24 family protein